MRQLLFTPIYKLMKNISFLKLRSECSEPRSYSVSLFAWLSQSAEGLGLCELIVTTAYRCIRNGTFCVF